MGNGKRDPGETIIHSVNDTGDRIGFLSGTVPDIFHFQEEHKWQQHD